jgi:hypothetical protein
MNIFITLLENVNKSRTSANNLSLTACCGKNAKAAENGHICQLFKVFQRFVTHSRFAHAAHQAVTVKAGVC